MQLRFLAAAMALSALISVRAEAQDVAAVMDTYADLALAEYQDALAAAEALDFAIEALVAQPTAAGLEAAKAAWVSARVPYQQTEAYRFGNPLVDDWEGKVNAWPLDEGMIDYVVDTYGTESDLNAFYALNVIAIPQITVGGEQLDATTINADLLRSLHEIGGVEANVATGYHAIEFLLWGQDLNGTGPGEGARPHTDFDTANCSGGNCERRAAYLLAVSDLLVADLEEIVAAWDENGAARQDANENGLAAILTGMGSLSYGELAGERMKLGLLLHDPEEEHDCFSDNTHNSHYYDAMGIANVYLGRYRRMDGSMVEGPSLSDLLRAADAALDDEMRGKLAATTQAMARLKARAESEQAYDQMIGEGNTDGNAVVQAAIDALIDQTRTIERIAAELALGSLALEGSDSLDSPEAVFQ